MHSRTALCGLLQEKGANLFNCLSCWQDTKFATDGHFGLIKKAYRRTRVDTIASIQSSRKFIYMRSQQSTADSWCKWPHSSTLLWLVWISKALLQSNSFNNKLPCFCNQSPCHNCTQTTLTSCRGNHQHWCASCASRSSAWADLSEGTGFGKAMVSLWQGQTILFQHTLCWHHLPITMLSKTKCHGSRA